MGVRTGRLRRLTLVYVVAIAAAVGLLASACSAANTKSSAQTSSKVDPTGIIRIAAVINSTGGAQLDPSQSSITLDSPWLTAIYGTLLQEQPDGSIAPWMAKSYKIVNPTTVSLTLRPGMKFSDGSPFDGQAVKDGLMRTLTKSSPSSTSAQDLAFRQIGSIDVNSPTEVTIHLKSDVAGSFITSLTNPREGSIVSPKMADAPQPKYPDVDPIGAGPFVLKQFVPNQYILVTKNPTYYDAKNWKLGGLEWIQTLPGPPTTTALLSGSVDIAQIAATDVASVKSRPDITVTSVASQIDYVSLNLCATKPPLNNLAVRQAVSLALNRNQISQLWQAGTAAPQYAYWPASSPQFNPATKSYVTYDPAKAKQLLQQAGVTSLDFKLVWSESQPYQQLAEIIQEQLANIGIKVTLTPLQDTIGSWISPQGAGMMLSKATRPVPDQIAATLAGGLTTLCGIKHPDIQSLLAQAAQYSTSDPRAIAIYKKIDLIVAQNVWTIFVSTQPADWAINTSTVGGEPIFSTITGQMFFNSMYAIAR